MKTDNSPDAAEDTSRIQEIIRQNAINQKLDCIAAFEIADMLNVSPGAVGRTLDLMDCRITHCQLGLFGHSPEKKIVTPETAVDSEIKLAIEAAAADGRLSCRKAWQIAARFRIAKLSVSNTCEGLGIKIKPCQLGAF